MIESWSVSGCWGPRPEPAIECARRWLTFFLSLEALDVDELRGWGIPKGSPRDVPDLPQELSALTAEVADGQSPDDELGFTLGAWNRRQREQSVSFTSSCGGSSDAVLNNAFLGLQAATGADVRKWARLANDLLTALAEAWQPDWGYFVSDSLRDQQEREDPRSPVAGYVTYLSPGRRAALPRDVRARVSTTPDGGVLISLVEPDGSLPKPQDVLRLAKTLTKSGAFAPTPEDSPVLLRSG
jgi:Immunity protein 52